MSIKEYTEENLLMLSGIQHIAFCERQWALIHMENQWTENLFTIEGYFLHERADDPFEDEIRGDLMYWRSHSLISRTLGFYGRADVVELSRTTNEEINSISVKGREGKWLLAPVEYKRGKPKVNDCDRVQLCAQSICLEEMYHVHIPEGFLFYGQTRHRVKVEFETDLRLRVKALSERMHEIFESGITPLAEYLPHCKSCSLVDICLPKSMGNRLSGTEYLKLNL